MKKLESDNTEFKESWRDEYLKTLCAFANTKGGELYVGITDSGQAKGISDKKKMLEDIPNKVKDHLGILAEVQIKKKQAKEFLSIKIKAYDSPISYKSKYYIRSGSTTQELNGAELHSFILNKSNTSWESLIEDKASINDIDPLAVERFRELAAQKSLPAGKEKNVLTLLSKLHLVEKGKLTRAAILLFGKDPQQFYSGCFIKIGKFTKEEELLSSDEIKGNLFYQAERALDILKNKYLISEVQIKGLYRTENLEYPESALREALVNAIAHKEYSGSHIQIKIYPDKLTFWNPGVLPKGLTVALLKKNHPSHPRNKLIADVFHDSGLIERWGHGTVKMVKDCVNAALPEPSFEEHGGGMLITFPKDIYTEDFLLKKGLNERQIKGVLYIKEFGSITNQHYQQISGATKRTASRDLAELLEINLLDKTGSTGKGTNYSLRGQKGDKGDNVKAEKKNKKSIDELDKKLNSLHKELAIGNSGNDIQGHFNQEKFFQIYDSWLSEALKKLIIVGQKFNSFFTEPRHSIMLANEGINVSFGKEKPETIINQFKTNCINKKDRIQRDARIILSFNYSAFRRTDKNRKTFGCNYDFEVEFSMIGYAVFINEFDEKEPRKKVQCYERLLHEPLTSSEIALLAQRLGDTLYQHIDYHTKKLGIR